MNNHSRTPSLWTYLNPDQGNFKLKISLTTKDVATVEKTSFPFLLLTDSDPLAHLLEGKFITDAGSEIKKVFLLLQRDQYSLTRDDLWPLNNKDINYSWQKAFSFHAAQKANGSFIILGQVDQKEGLQPFQSLFFCKVRELYFHPLCPQCGLELHECQDDALLLRSGLQAYSASLKRYLFCPSCFSGGKTDFYASALDNFDPPTLKDRFTLIKEFGRLVERGKPANLFPCLDCANHPDCYGPNFLALLRIVPFSFYPFFMFIFEAMSLSAKDFLPILSGATFEEIQTKLEAGRELGRENCLRSLQQDSLTRPVYLFDRTERYFLEVFYLKLSFLHEVLRSLLSEGGFYENPHLRFSLERIWVKLAAEGNLLPSFWNFKIQLMDIHRNCKETQPFPKIPQADGLYFLGQLWFYTLLVNKKQNISEIYPALGKAIDRAFSGDLASFGEGSPAFYPENIFWNPQRQAVRKIYLPLWEKALGLGCSLIKFSLKQDGQWSPEIFFQQLEALREEAKENLFRERPGKEEKEFLPEKQAIHKILEKLLRKWQMEVEPAREELMETIILGPEKYKKDAPAPSIREWPIKEEAPETVMISPGGIPKMAPAAPCQERKEPEDISETVIISPSQAKGQEEPLETIIVSPAKAPAGVGRVSTAFPPEDASVLGGKVPALDVEKAVSYKKQSEEPKEEDFLSETVILSPKEVREKKEKHGSKR
ncbi:MAG: hypothetical protein FJ117_02070 [Deltaproteobacteria bacterium]|nr:hypothetical protein [Deltaproteobacteria bacterium]